MIFLITIAILASIAYIWQRVSSQNYVCPRCNNETLETVDYWGDPVIKCTVCYAEFYE